MDTVQITGKVINDSGKALPAELKVTLKIFDNMEETDTVVTTVDVMGSYQFADIPMNADRIVIATVDYGGQIFNSDPSRLPTTDPEVINTSTNITLDVHISESTSDTSSISVDRLHIFFDFSREDVVQIVQLFLVSNNSGQTIVAQADGEGVLYFDLPSGATNLQFQDSVIGERYLATETGFTDTASIPPGDDSLQVLFAFDMPYTGKEDFSLSMPYNISTVIVMAPTDGVRFKSSQLVDGGIRTTDQSNFRVYTGSDFSAGSQLNFNLTGQPADQADKVSGLKLDSAIVGAVVLAIALLAAAVYLFQHRRLFIKKQATALNLEKLDKDTLMDAIIALDEQHKNGKIGDVAYQQRRTELKNQLKRIV